MKRKVNALKAALFVIGLIVFLFTTILAFQFFKEGVGKPVVVIFFSSVILSVILGFRVLFLLNQILTCIEHLEAFSQKTLQLVSKVKNTILTISFFFLGILPFFYQVADSEDAPGVMVIGLVVAMIPFVAYIFSQIVEELFKNATSLRIDSELTI